MTHPRNPHLCGVDPATLAPSAFHVRSAFSVSDQFVHNVSTVGLIQPPIARHEGGELRLVDGVRRAMAAARADLDEIPVIVYEMDDAEAVQVSITTNVFRKAVTERDEESALRMLAGGPRRPLREWEQSDEVFEAKRALGLVDETDVMLHAVGGADGVGDATALALADEFGDPETVTTATIEELQRADGVGPKTARAIREHLDRIECGGSAVVWNESEATDK